MKMRVWPGRPYCHDNELTWLHWEPDERKTELLKFVRRVVRVFHEQPVFHRRRFFHGKAIQGVEAPETRASS